MKTPTVDLSLTARERQVLVAVAQGMPDKQIADKFDISFSTVRFHLKNTMQKLGAQNRTEAALKFISEQIPSIGLRGLEREI